MGNVDGETLISSSVTPLAVGEQVLLFLIEQTAAEDSPGLTLFDTYYTVLSLDNGVFDVLSNGDVRPRAPQFLTTGSDSVDRADLTRRVSSGG